MSIETGEITVEQFLAMDLPRDCKWRLHRGTAISLTFPKYPHSLIQRNLGRLLDRCFENRAAVHVSFPYRLSQVEAHEADVAVVSDRQHREALSSGAILDGAPELVVEVMSRLNVGYRWMNSSAIVSRTAPGSSGGSSFADPKCTSAAS
jgi:Uma2 family endonuclease